MSNIMICFGNDSKISGRDFKQAPNNLEELA
jgi:hypothetical protein